MSIRRIVCVATIAVLGWQGGNPRAQTVEVRGAVYGTDAAPLPGVRVTVWRQGVPEMATSDADGSYRVALAGGARIDIIQYTRSDLDLSVIVNLSGREDQVIAKVLYRRGEQRPVTGYADSVQALQTMWAYNEEFGQRVQSAELFGFANGLQDRALSADVLESGAAQGLLEQRNWVVMAIGAGIRPPGIR